MDKRTKVEALKKSIMASASPVGSCTYSLETSDGQGIMGKFPLEEFYNEGFVALTQQDWVEYFLRLAQGEHPSLVDLRHTCEAWLKKNVKEVSNPKLDESRSSSPHDLR